MCRTPKRGDTSSNTCKRVGTRRTCQTNGRGRRILFVVGMQDQDAIHCLGQNRIDFIVFTRVAKHHLQEVFCITELVVRIAERLTDGIFIRHRRNGRHFRNQAIGRNHPLLRIVDVGAVMIERGQCANNATHDRHRMRITAETVIEIAHLFVDHGVHGNIILELGFVGGIRQLTIKQQMADFEEVGIFCKFINCITAVTQNTNVAINIGQFRLARAGRSEARIIGEISGFSIQLADVNHRRAYTALNHRHIERLASGIVGHCHGVGSLGIRCHDYFSFPV